MSRSNPMIGNRARSHACRLDRNLTLPPDKDSDIHSPATLLGTPVLLLVIANLESASHMAATQFI